ncbi:tyrosine-type recombinase/integrase [Domibacillus enclensis]|uniref:Site-specific integrase n=1 Tax=Domibacillus enclensis TaxID=1017273 RepID=A0A1N6WDU1_9BACI|nr:tyrosine-type recombinase/integrase [Domibacillus enclensis]OXS77910.1 site-specific integrase [Domibacillus enclensis]SIQ88146.1 Site-specific recombinase XerD [Domibacillus enclensis]
MSYLKKVDAKNKQGYAWKCTSEGPRDPITGKRRQVTRRALTKKEAQAKVDEAIEEMIKQDKRGVGSDMQDMTVRQLLIQWFDLVMKHRLKETTLKSYINTMQRRVIPVMGDVRVAALNTIFLQNFINNLNSEDLSPRYIEYISTVLYGAFEAARKWGVIEVNPLNDVERPRPRQVSFPTWTREEAQHFLNTALLSNLRMYTVVSTAFKTGVRRGEVLALKWSDVDFENAEINIERSLVYDKEGFRFSKPKTKSSVRKIKVGDSLLTDLKRWKGQQNELKMIHRKIFVDHDLVFTTETGKPIYPRTMTHMFNQIIKEAGVPKIRFHDLRHTHATLCLESGMSLKDVQDRLGHGNIQTTGNVYAHVTNNMKEKSTQLFEDYISKI